MRMSVDANESPSLELGRFVTVLRRRWLAVVAGLLIGGLLAAAFLALTTRTATATTLVNINVFSAQPFSQSRPDSDLVDAQTETQLVRSSEVVTAVSRTLGGTTTPQDVRSATTAELLATGTVVRIQYSAPTLSEAEEGADALAKEYLAYRSQLAEDKVDAVVKNLNKRRNDLSEQLSSIQERLSVTTATTTRARLQAQYQVANQALSSITQQQTSLQSLDTSGGVVLTSASAGTTVVSPRTWVVIASGALGGLLLGMVFAFLVNVADRRVRDAHDVEAAGGGAILARLRRDDPVHPTDQEADAVRSLRERLLANLPEPNPVVAVADVSGQGISPNIAVNLALASAHIGMQVHLVLPEYSARYASNLSDALRLVPVESDQRLPRSVSQIFPNVSVTLPSLQLQGDDNAADQTIDLLQANADEGFDLTLIALPKDSSRSLRLAVGRTGHAFVLVVAERHTRIDEVAAIAAELLAVNAVIHGSVLVGRERRFRRRRSKRGQTRPEASPASPPERPRESAGSPVPAQEQRSRAARR
jgi:capsular polysaccharide biosynthesis protein